MSWFLSEAAVTFRKQVDKEWPNRDTASDGDIGDTSHQASVSDHNPDYDAGGVVRAIDLDRDLSKKDRDAMERLVGQLRRYCKAGKDGERVAYIIFDRAIASNTYGWVWKPYNGTNPHDHHCHISYTSRGDHRPAPFNLPVFGSKWLRVAARLADRIDRLKRKRATALRKAHQ